MAPAPLGSNWDGTGLLLTCPELVFAVNLIQNESYLGGCSLPPLGWVRMAPAPLGPNWDATGLLLTCPELAFAVNLIQNKSYLGDTPCPPWDGLGWPPPPSDRTGMAPAAL